MVGHPAVRAARTAYARGDVLFQYVLALSTQSGPVPAGLSRPISIDEGNQVLNAVAAAGWELVTASAFGRPDSATADVMYVWRRR
ncbi:hypothetical protein GCM10010399_28900 [Dactylosporangium fulvum]|uniref:DUF4177 domain-containing protein n=1 Tax=Dactylosporangium fulvum TaxID=53359 RepID=A0ABY5W816_9ACTN|nr:hypothetical protein [Dactylosporangium fulvum]UWP86242.1 hypothetical protein Dfulv_19160 [Dactylosporangium fulvum]